MMNVRIGTCSICGGDVFGFTGTWMSITPPPPAKCNQCGATDRSDVIQMHKAGGQRLPFEYTWEKKPKEQE